MSENIEYEDLRGTVETAVQKLRYLNSVMEGCDAVEDLEPCVEMARGFIDQIADDLENEIKTERK